MALATRNIGSTQPAAITSGGRSSHISHGSSGSAEQGAIEGSGAYNGVAYGGAGNNGSGHNGAGFQFSGDMSQQYQQRQQNPEQQQRDPFSLFNTPSATFASLFAIEHDVVKTDGSAAGGSPLRSIVNGAITAYEKTALAISGMQSPLGGSLSMRL